MSEHRKSLWERFLDKITVNPVTLSGASDVIVVEQENGSFKTTKFNLRVGQFRALKTKNKSIDIMINGIKLPIKMKLNKKGVAYFDY